MRSWIPRLTLTSLVLMGVAVFGDSTDQADSVEHTTEFITQQKAVERALEVFGTRTEEGYRATAAEDSTAMVTMRDSTTPFLSTAIDGRTAWRVVLQLSPPDTAKQRTNSAARAARDFDVFIDAEDGKLIKIVSRLEGFDEKAWHKPTAKAAEDQISRSDQYHGFPNENPGVTLLNLLVSPSSTIYDARMAQEITAFYIMYSSLSGPEPRPVWELYLYGLETSVSGRYPEQPFYQSDFSRVTVDAMTGEFIHASNTPYPR